MNDKNMLLGYGETLTGSIILNRGGGGKNKPYTYTENKPVISQQLGKLISEINEIPPSAMPEGKAVAKFVLHPTFLAKSYFPVGLLDRFSLGSIGSKAIKIKPRKDIKRKGGEMNTQRPVFMFPVSKKIFSNFWMRSIKMH